MGGTYTGIAIRDCGNLDEVPNVRVSAEEEERNPGIGGPEVFDLKCSIFDWSSLPPTLPPVPGARRCQKTMGAWKIAPFF